LIKRNQLLKYSGSSSVSVEAGHVGESLAEIINFDTS